MGPARPIASRVFFLKNFGAIFQGIGSFLSISLSGAIFLEENVLMR